MEKLTGEELIESTYWTHPLRGTWRGHLECHIEPDWLLIWYTSRTEIVFVRTGTHSDLFEE